MASPQKISHLSILINQIKVNNCARIWPEADNEVFWRMTARAATQIAAMVQACPHMPWTPHHKNLASIRLSVMRTKTLPLTRSISK